jgi:hypothetical protein
MTTSRRIGSYTLKFEHWKHDNTCDTAKVGRWVVAFLITKRYPTFSTHSNWAKELSSNCIFWTPRLFFLFISFRTYPPCTFTGAGFLRMDGTVLRFVCLPSIISFHTSLDSFSHAPTCSFLSIYLLIMFLALLIIFGLLFGMQPFSGLRRRMGIVLAHCEH